MALKVFGASNRNDELSPDSSATGIATARSGTKMVSELLTLFRKTRRRRSTRFRDMILRQPFRFFVTAMAFAIASDVFAQAVAVKILPGHVPAVVARLQANGRLPGNTSLSLAIGLPLRNQVDLANFLAELYDPASTNFHKFVNPQEFTGRFGPTESDYEAVQAFVRSNGFIVTGIHSNRLVLDVEAPASVVERAFHVTLRTYRHPTEPRDFYAPDTDPSVPTNIPIVDLWGLSDYGIPKPLSRKLDPLKVHALAGSGPSGYYAGDDFRNAYVPGTTLTGAGQQVGLLEFSAYYRSDITNYQNTIGRSSYVPLTDVVIGHPGPTTANNAEVALDIEVAIAMAPALSQIIVYETRSINPSSILSRMANDNLAKQLSSSWSWSGGPSTTIDSIFQQMAAQGQSFFQASGDSDAYTGNQTLDNSSLTMSPVDSAYVTSVGGTTLSMNGAGTSWSSETVWNYNSRGGSYANVGSGGGISTYYSIPFWQTNVSMAANSGSTTWRNIPDVALTADSVYVAYNNGSSGGFAGTSCAAPLWAGLCALLNQQSVASSGTPVGFLNPTLYTIAAGSNYANCFHDITTGNNIGTNTPGLFNAVAGYDLCTGLGTPNGIGLIDALAPSSPIIVVQPTSQNVTNGTSVVLSVTASGSPPLGYQWLFNGTNLTEGGNISGTTSDVLSIVSASIDNSGGYQLLVTNGYSSVTSSVAVLNVGFAPDIISQPTNLIAFPGDAAVFSTSVAGTSPLVFQWQKDGTNLVDGGGISGTTSDTLTLNGVTAASAGSYNLSVTNIYGTSTSVMAVLTVALPPSITGSVTNRTIECGSNIVTFSVTASGTPPFGYQWSLDAMPIAEATNSSYSLTNLLEPDHNISVTVTNSYGSVTSNVLVTVSDSLPPMISLNGADLINLEFGNAFIDPGAVANDTCAGTVSVTVLGVVNTNSVGTNVLTYIATDGNGNTNRVTRSVVVRDATPPTILWSFTNLVLAAGTNCDAQLPDVTGTNFIVADDLSGPLSITQDPTNGTMLANGTNTVVITAADTFGNLAYSTNTVVVQDQTPPVITVNGDNPMVIFVGTGFVDPGATAADACAGIVPVMVSGTVNTNTAGTNTITYLAMDSNANTNSVDRIVIVEPNITPAITGVAPNNGGGVTLTLLGAPGYTYHLEMTPDLASPGSWQPIATNTVDSSGAWEFTDTEAANFPRRFYRLVLGP